MLNRCSVALPITLGLAALVACGDDGSEKAADGGGVGCPMSAQAPLGFRCNDEGLSCRYGYDPAACGGRTVICRDQRWQELEHSDPQPACFDAGGPPLDAQLPSLDAASDARMSDASDATARSDALVGSCQPTPSSGGCSYVRTEGSATVRAIETPTAAMYSCKNSAVVVRFTFVPDDPARAACFRSDEENDNTFTFRVGGGANPPRACLEAANVRIGSVLRATRADIASGTCTPVVFDFPRSLADACLAACMY